MSMDQMAVGRAAILNCGSWFVFSCWAGGPDIMVGECGVWSGIVWGLHGDCVACGRILKLIILHSL
jgi:hypothetical protein